MQSAFDIGLRAYEACKDDKNATIRVNAHDLFEALCEFGAIAVSEGNPRIVFSPKTMMEQFGGRHAKVQPDTQQEEEDNTIGTTFTGCRRSLRMGKNVRREHWPSGDCVWMVPESLEKGTPPIFLRRMGRQVMVWLPLVEDLFAVDWVLV